MHWLLASSSSYRASLLAKLNVKFDQSSPDIDERAVQGENALQLSLRLSLLKALQVAQHNKQLGIIASDQTAQIVHPKDIQGTQKRGTTANCLNMNSSILSKPHNHENAVKQLSALSNNVAVFLTGLCVLCPINSVSSQTTISRIKNLNTYSPTDGLTFINNLSDNDTQLNISLEFLIDVCEPHSGGQHIFHCQLLAEPFFVHFKELSPENIHNYIALEKPFDCAGSFKSEGLGIALFKKMQGDDPNSLIGLPLIRLLTCFSNIGFDVLT